MTAQHPAQPWKRQVGGCLIVAGGLPFAMCVALVLYALISGDWSESVISYLGTSFFALPLFWWGLSWFRANRDDTPARPTDHEWWP